MIGHQFEGIALALIFVDTPGCSPDNRRAVIHRVVEGSAGHHQPVQTGDGDANLLAGPGAEQVVSHRTVEKETFAVMPVGHRQHQRPIGSGHPHMGDQPSIEYAQYIILGIPGSASPPAHFDPLRWCPWMTT